jgi:hypothetical protein
MSTAMQKQAYSPALVDDLQAEAHVLRQKARCAYFLNQFEAAARLHGEAEELEINADILKRCLRRAGAQ